MRIMFAITRGEVGGAQEHVRILATGLVAEGHEVGIVVEQPSHLADILELEGATIYRWHAIARDLSPHRDVAARRELRRHVSSFRPDILHLHSAKAGLLGRGLTGDACATVYTCHHAAFGPARQWSHRLVARPAEQLTLPRLDGIISVGARDAPLLRKLAPKVPLQVIRNAVPWSGEPLAPEEPVPHALWVARLKRPKDPLLAVRAWEDVVREVPEAQLTICGEGPLENALRTRIERSPARSNIRFLGHVPILAEVQSTASIFLLASDVEGGITMATLEAMTQGLVPVVSDAGDAWLHEVLGTGMVVPRRAPAAMAEAVITLIRMPERLRDLRARAIEYGRHGWTVEDMIRATAAFYRRVLHDR